MVFWFLFLQIFWPFCHYGTKLFGLEFYFCNDSLYLILSAVLAILLSKKKKDAPAFCNIAAFPVAVISSVWTMLITRSVLAVPYAVIQCVCGYTFLTSVSQRWYKYAAMALNTLLILAFCGICFLRLTFGMIGKLTVVQEVSSPGGAYTAQLLDDDQGALGGNTLVRIQQPNLISLGLFSIRPQTRTIYRGGWGEFDHIDLTWQDEATLLINNKPYTVN